MNEQINAFITWIVQALGAGVATAIAMVAAGGDLSQKTTWAGIATAAGTAAWAHLRESPLPSKTTPTVKS